MHGSFNNNRHFLNKMSLANQVFIFRSIIDLQNEELNRINITANEANTNLVVNFDNIGHVIFGHKRTEITRNEMLEETDQFPVSVESSQIQHEILPETFLDDNVLSNPDVDMEGDILGASEHGESHSDIVDKNYSDFEEREHI